MRADILRLSPHEAAPVTLAEFTAAVSPHASCAPAAGSVFPVGPDESAEKAHVADTMYWLDLSDAADADWERLLRDLNVPECDLEACLDNRRFPQAESLTGPGLVLRLPVRDSWRDERSEYLSLVLLERGLLTRRDGTLLALGKARKRLLEGDRPGTNALPGLLLYFLEGIMEAGITDMLQARNLVDDLEDRLEDAPENVHAPEVRALKHDVDHFAGQIEEQLFCLALLRGLGTQGLAPMHAELAELADGLAHLQRGLQRLESRLEGFLRQLDSRLRNRTDQRLRVLTLVSAIFMPLTFITGLYGMNFSEMPGLNTPGAYWLVFAVMAAMGVGMLLFFWWKGWFK